MSLCSALARTCSVVLLALAGACAAPAVPPAPAGAAPPAAGSSRAAQPLERVTIGWVRTVNLAGLNVAIGRGYFVEEGIDLVTEEFSTAADLVAALGTGQLDVNGGTVAAGHFNAWQRGVRMDIGAPMSSMPVDGPMSQNVVVRKELVDSGQVQSAADFRGRKLAVNAKGGINEFLVEKVLERRGLTVNDVDLTILPYPDQVTALTNGSIDVLTGNEPFGTLAIELGAGVRLLDDQRSVIAGFQPTHFIFSEQFATVRTEWATRFLMAIIRANRDLQGDWKRRPSVAKIVSDEVGVRPDLLDKTIFPEYPTHPRTNLTDLVQMQETFIKLGELNYTQPLDPANFVNNQLPEEAARRLDARRS